MSIPNPLPRALTAILRGLCMVMIVLSHAASSVQADAFALPPIGITARLGYLGTGVFFFLSGYGLWLSLGRMRQGEARHWLMTHICRLLLPFLFTAVVYQLLLLTTCIPPEAVCLPSEAGNISSEALNLPSETANISCESASLKASCALWHAVLSLSLPTADLWFLKAILALYLLIFLTFRLFKKPPHRISSLLLAVGTYYLAARLSAAPQWWWNTVCNFPLGALFAYLVFEKPHFYPILSRFIPIASRLNPSPTNPAPDSVSLNPSQTNPTPGFVSLNPSRMPLILGFFVLGGISIALLLIDETLASLTFTLFALDAALLLWQLLPQARWQKSSLSSEPVKESLLEKSLDCEPVKEVSLEKSSSCEPAQGRQVFPILTYIGTHSIFFYLLEVPAMDIRPEWMPTGNFLSYTALVLTFSALLAALYRRFVRF